MTDNHPITPPPELVRQWRKSAPADAAANNAYERHIATQAARWGADQELEACCEWLRSMVGTFSAAAHLQAQRRSDELRTARRPKPPSLKEQALLAIDVAVADGRFSPDVSNVVRRALEALDD